MYLVLVDHTLGLSSELAGRFNSFGKDNDATERAPIIAAACLGQYGGETKQ